MRLSLGCLQVVDSDCLSIAANADPSAPPKPALPPLPDIIDEAKLAEFGFKWIPQQNGVTPALAVEGGSAGLKNFQALYVSRVHYGGGIYAGKTSQQLGGTNFGANGEEKVLKEYETLTATDADKMRRVRWVKVKSTAELAHCVGQVSGGLRDATGNVLVVARKYFRNGVHVGNTGRNLPGEFFWFCRVIEGPFSGQSIFLTLFCIFPWLFNTIIGISFSWGGKERIEATDFEILCIE